MQITAIKTDIIVPNATSLLDLIDVSITSLPEGSVLAVTSKVVSLCEGRVVDRNTADKHGLMIQESERYLLEGASQYGFHFTITNNTLIPTAGIDESNGAGYYVLWPSDSQKTANDVRAHLAERFGLKDVGVVITDSTCQPLRRGTTGIVLAHSGFTALHSYVGQMDLFDRPYGTSHANVAGGLAAAAVVAMGEGSERTPFAVLSDLPFVQFSSQPPSAEELQNYYVPLEDDLFAPFLLTAPWQQGGKHKN